MQYATCFSWKKNKYSNMCGKEIQFVKDRGVPVFGVYIDGSVSNTNLSDELSCNRTISLD